jgi:rhamnogalacturonyl hydrolase YesR
MDKAGANGNYFESSAACMFVYALAKARAPWLLAGEVFSRR